MDGSGDCCAVVDKRVDEGAIILDVLRNRNTKVQVAAVWFIVS